MNKFKLSFAAAMLSLFLALSVQPAMAATITNYNDTHTYIAGTGGSPNTGWTSNTDTQTGAAVFLRMKNRSDGTTPTDGAGNYSFAVDAPGPRGIANYEFAFSGGNSFLSNFDLWIAVDIDPTAGVNMVTLNAGTHWVDNSWGTGATAAAGGLEGLASVYQSISTEMANSQNKTFGDYAGGSPLGLYTDATLTYNAWMTTAGTGPNGLRIVDVTINQVIGNGGASVPDGGASAGLLALGLIGLAALKKQLIFGA